MERVGPVRLRPSRGPAFAALAASEPALRGAGLSGSKAAAIRELAEKAGSGAVPLDDLGELEDRAVIDRLVQVRGVGRWTAQMHLLFELCRPDVWPAGHGPGAGGGSEGVRRKSMAGFGAWSQGGGIGRGRER